MEKKINDLRQKITNELLTSNSVDEKLLVSFLEKLYSFENINCEIILNTDIGILINKLRFVGSTQTQKIAKQIFTKWSKIIQNENKNKSKIIKPYLMPEKTDNLNQNLNQTKTVVKRISDVDFFKGKKTGNQKRDQMKILFFEELKNFFNNFQSEHKVDIFSIIDEMEEAIYESKKRESIQNYRSKCRFIMANLIKDNEKSLELRQDLFLGKLDPKKLSEFENSHFMTEKQKEDHEKLIEQGINDALTPEFNKEENSTDFLCEKCNQKRCKIWTLQTLRADEPMTVYICNF
ncbi:transcription elongation factor tfiis [Anaeramoeba ignava]|uniref:Transcription elongation factor tfiis n=1 Tax=Anaeramoeba ignava TaxID=1746090 RepID=A0A9Q0LN60_ANAIG|nr:transcription elongation factor tfiis [Anaeramoeba ignava]